MPVRYIYKTEIIGGGTIYTVPHEGQFVEFQSIDKVFIVTDVMFKTVLSGDVIAMVYLADTTQEKERRLRNYK